MKTLIWTKFNTTSFFYDLETDKKWLDERIRILNKYTLPSVKKQTDNYFYWVLEVREETEKYICDRVEQFDNLYILPVPTKKDDRDGKRRRIIEDAVEDLVTEDVFYYVRLNSDDMYHKDFIKTLHSMKTGSNEAIIPQLGYYYYVNKDKLVKLRYPSPPFYVLIYDTKKWMEGFRYDIPKGHRQVIKNLRYIVMDGRQWVWVIHDINNKLVRKAKYPPYQNYEICDKLRLEDFR